MISYDEVILDPDSMTGALRRGQFRYRRVYRRKTVWRQTQRKYHVTREAEIGRCVHKPSNAKARKDFPINPSEKVPSCQHLHFRLLAPRTETVNSVVEKTATQDVALIRAQVPFHYHVLFPQP